MSDELKQIEETRKGLRDNLRNTRSKWHRLLYFFKRRKWQAEYEQLGLLWGIKRPGHGLNLTGAILLNDDGERIDSDEFKNIAVEKIFGEDGPEYKLKAEYDSEGNLKAPGITIPASEIYQMTEKEAEPFKIYRYKEPDQ